MEVFNFSAISPYIAMMVEWLKYFGFIGGLFIVLALIFEKTK